MNYLTSPTTGRRFPLGGFIPSTTPSTEPSFGSIRKYSDKELPPSVDLRSLMTPVEDQQDMNSCVANALAAAYEFLIMKNTKKHIDVSRLFIYYNSRKLDGFQEYNMQDQGTQITSAVRGLAQYGCCKETSYPYVKSAVNRQPPSMCYDEAHQYRITKAVQIKANLSEMKACLAEGYPFVFGLQTFSSFHQAETNRGRVPMPQPFYESQNQQHGWHAMLAVGYSDKFQCFIVKNSWGPNYGDRGYLYIPYEYMSNPEYCRDLHTVQVISEGERKKDNSEIPNTFNWNLVDNKFKIDYWKIHNSFFQDKFFWIWDNSHHSPTPDWQVVKVDGFSWFFSSTNSNSSIAFETVSKPTDSCTTFILWIDEKSKENLSLVSKLKDHLDVQVEFCSTLSEAKVQLMKNIRELQFTMLASRFLIITRGFYKSENQNPLNLLEFLNEHNLKHLPVLVFTQDCAGVKHHLKHQAPSMKIFDWSERVWITNNVQEILEKIRNTFNV